MFHEYPKAMYRHGVYRQVLDADGEQAAMADGWLDYYADQERVGAEQQEPAAGSADDIEGLRKAAEAAGVKVDKRWGAAKVRDAIAQAGKP